MERKWKGDRQGFECARERAAICTFGLIVKLLARHTLPKTHRILISRSFDYDVLFTGLSS